MLVVIALNFCAGCRLTGSEGRAVGKRILTRIAIDIVDPKGFKRCQMAPVADASPESLYSSVSDNVEPGEDYHRRMAGLPVVAE
jgi:hypothetical protein